MNAHIKHMFFLFGLYLSLCKMCPYPELFWSAFSRIRTEYWEIGVSVCGMWENADQNNSEYEHFLRSAYFNKKIFSLTAASVLEILISW